MKFDSIVFAVTIIAFCIGCLGVLFLADEYSHQENMMKIESWCIQRGLELNRPAEEIERICDYERKE